MIRYGVYAYEAANQLFPADADYTAEMEACAFEADLRDDPPASGLVAWHRIRAFVCRAASSPAFGPKIFNDIVGGKWNDSPSGAADFKPLTLTLISVDRNAAPDMVQALIVDIETRLGNRLVPRPGAPHSSLCLRWPERRRGCPLRERRLSRPCS